MAIATNANGMLFFRIYYAGLSSWTGGKVAAILFAGGSSLSFTSVATAPDDRLWIGTRGAGLWTLKNARLRLAEIEVGPSPQSAVGALFIHPATGKLYASLEEKAAVLQCGLFVPIMGVSAVVQDFLVLGEDSPLVPNSRALKRLHQGEVMPYKSSGLADSAVPPCVIRYGQEMWIGTDDQGALHCDTRTRRAFIINRAAGLRSNFLYNLAPGLNGAFRA